MDPSRSPPRIDSSIPETPFPRFSVRGVRSHRVRERKLRNSVMQLGRGAREWARPSATDYTRSCLFVSGRRAKLAIRDRELEARTLSL